MFELNISHIGVGQECKTKEDQVDDHVAPVASSGEEVFMLCPFEESGGQDGDDDPSGLWLTVPDNQYA